MVNPLCLSCTHRRIKVRPTPALFVGEYCKALKIWIAPTASKDKHERAYPKTCPKYAPYDTL